MGAINRARSCIDEITDAGNGKSGGPSNGERACIDKVAGSDDCESVGGKNGARACDVGRPSPVESSALRQFRSHCSQQRMAHISYLVEADQSLQDYERYYQVRCDHW